MQKIPVAKNFKFPEIVEFLSKYGNVAIPIKRDMLDNIVIAEIKNEINKLIRSKAPIKIKGKMRINDINEIVLDTIIGLLRQNKDLNAGKIEKLQMNSYGDIRITFDNNSMSYYIELICTTKTEIKGDTLRGIYLSSVLRNINSDGKHILILLTFEMDEIKKVFYPKLSRLYDLYNANLNLKIEYSASLNDINNLEVL